MIHAHLSRRQLEGAGKTYISSASRLLTRVSLLYLVSMKVDGVRGEFLLRSTVHTV